MIDGKTGPPHGNLDRAEKGSFADQPDICFEGKPEIGEALDDTAVAPDKGNSGLLAGLESSDRYQRLVPGADGGRRVFQEAGRTALHVTVTGFDQTPVRAPGRSIKHLAEGTFRFIG
jgi:hypothetical protein